jgi:hypothetical protein
MSRTLAVAIQARVIVIVDGVVVVNVVGDGDVIEKSWM